MPTTAIARRRWTRSRAIQARRPSARSGQVEAKRTRRTCGPTTRTVSRLSRFPDFTTSSHIRVARGWLIRMTGRLRPGRSWHNRRCDRDREITGSSRRDPLNTSSRMRHCQEFPGTQAQPQPACRDPAAALWIGPREATDRHDQHKLTQPARSRRSPQTVLQEQKPQVRGHKTGSRDRTQPITCRLTEGPSSRRSRVPEMLPARLTCMRASMG